MKRQRGLLRSVVATELNLKCGLCGHWPNDLVTDCEHKPGEKHGPIVDGLCRVCRGGLADLGITPEQWREELKKCDARSAIKE